MQLQWWDWRSGAPHPSNSNSLVTHAQSTRGIGEVIQPNPRLPALACQKTCSGCLIWSIEQKIIRYFLENGHIHSFWEKDAGSLKVECGCHFDVPIDRAVSDFRLQMDLVHDGTVRSTGQLSLQQIIKLLNEPGRQHFKHLNHHTSLGVKLETTENQSKRRECSRIASKLP